MEKSDSDAVTKALQQIDKKCGELKHLSSQIWSNPETCFQEKFAHKVLTDYLDKEGFTIERNFIHDTGFRASFGNEGGVHVCVICEYDALPEIGHACGHNLIAVCGVAAGIGIKTALEFSREKGKVTVLGTPAEEGGGGKWAMIDGNVFDDIDIVMMPHPCPHNIARPKLLAKQDLSISFEGKSAHAAAFPWEGLNALDAAVMCYQAISNMRQQMRPTWRVHGIFTNGGVKPNIIPERADLLYYLRAPTTEELEELKFKVEGCIRGAALATGCKVNFTYQRAYLNLVNNKLNKTLASLYEKHCMDLGLQFSADESVKNDITASGDIGNVSQVVPTIQPGYSIHTTAGNHTRDFVIAAGSDEGHQATMIQAQAITSTALELLLGGNRTLLTDIKKEFEETFSSSA